jgi:prophage tail gpP-like protein
MKNKVIAVINNKIVDYFIDVNIHLVLNTIASTFKLTLYKNEANKDIFKPFAFPTIQIYMKEVNSKNLLFTGFLTNIQMTKKKEITTSSISGYSKPGILQHSHIPVALYPLEYENTTLRTIAEKVTRHFNLGLFIKGAANAECDKKIEKIEFGKEEPIAQAISRYTKEFGVTLSHDERGRLMFYKYVNIDPAESVILNDDKIIEISVLYNGNDMCTEMYGISEAEQQKGRRGKKSLSDRLDYANAVSVQTPYIKKINKKYPLKISRTITQIETDSKELQRLINSEIAKDARNFTVTVKKYGWDFDGKFPRAGFYLTLESADIGFEKTKMVIEEMKYTYDKNNNEVVEFSCVIVPVYSGILTKKTPY